MATTKISDGKTAATERRDIDDVVAHEADLV